MRSSAPISPGSKMISARRGVAYSSRTSVRLGLDDAAQDHGVVEDLPEACDALAQLAQLGLQVDAGQAGEPAELHVQDVLGLLLAEGERFGHEPGPGRADILRPADQGDDRVDHVESPEEPIEQVGPLLGLTQPVLRSAGDHVDLVVDVGLEGLDQVERPGDALALLVDVDEGDHVDAEAGLERGQLPQVVEHDVGVGVALEADDQLGVVAGRQVVHAADAVQLAAVDQLGDPGGDGVHGGLVGQLADHDLSLTGLGLLYLGLGPHPNGSTARSIGVPGCRRARGCTHRSGSQGP